MLLLTAVAKADIAVEISRILQGSAANSLSLYRPGIDASAINDSLRTWYKKRSYVPFYLEEDRPKRRAREIKQIIENSEADGLNPNDYYLPEIVARWDSGDERPLAELDILLTASTAALAVDAQVGREAYRSLDREEISEPIVSYAELYRASDVILSRDDIGEALAEQFPHHRQYLRMKTALAELRSIAQNGGWGVLSGDAPLKLGSRGQRVRELAKRLKTSGDLGEKEFVGDEFNTELEEGVKVFQQRHGLPMTGEVHQQTLAELNVSVQDRIQAVLVNLERWRWLAREFSESKEVFVNIAGYELFALDHSELALRLPVIVGKTAQATPVFSSQILYVEFNPYWNVPTSIAANEILPKLKKDRSYLEKEHMQLFESAKGGKSELNVNKIDWKAITPRQMNRYQLRQESGDWNALGKIKIVFPSDFDVYLHDTPNRDLFAKRTRAFSHGCIRVSNVNKLAAFLLDSADDPWTVNQIDEEISDGKNHRIKLPEPVLIHVTYRTAWVDTDQRINFRPDIYGRDAKLRTVVHLDSPD